ncbi:substrate-binding periplasmic protein [Bdellovibrio sp. HCB2-146]|uniref:substrate-binding periplasmic protein n=1 Tax=Bdellovibrio sp. HCB2-146 TaxID=3394362 RepID=UPI0039BC60C1
MRMLLLTLVLSWNPWAAHAAEPGNLSSATYGVNSDYAMPLVDIKRIQNTQTLDAGILKDLGEALFKEMHLVPTITLLPKKRVAPSLLSGSANVICHLNEIWQTKIAKDVYWSRDVYESSNVIVYIGNKPLHQIKDLYGLRVGTVLNFVYRDLEPHFISKRILREDGPNNESNLQKLLNGRISAIIMSNLEYNYYKKIYSNLDSAAIEMDTIMTKCALSKKSKKITLEKLNKAIDAIQKNGTLDKILKTYQ